MHQIYFTSYAYLKTSDHHPAQRVAVPTHSEGECVQQPLSPSALICIINEMRDNRCDSILMSPGAEHGDQCRGPGKSQCLLVKHFP